MKKLIVSILLVALTALGTGCYRLQASLGGFSNQGANVEFRIDEVMTTSQSGSVTMQGTASLPDGTEVSVAAVRVLDALTNSDRFLENSLYAILDRQFVEIEGNRWQTSLTLRQPDASNDLYESWQLNLDLRQQATSPSPNVLFLATIEPREFTGDVGAILNQAEINNGDSQLSFTAAGEPYLQVSQSMAVQVPAGTAIARTEDFTQAQYQELWTSRANFSPRVDPSAETVQLPFAQEDNLPLPTANLMK